MIDPQLFMQIDMDTPLRLSPKVFINRDDENYFTIGLYDEKDARKYLKHFLTIAYSFCDYVAPVELMTMWPPETVNDLLNAINTLKKEQILLDKEKYEEVAASITSEFLQEEKQFLEDKAWLDPNLEAIKTIKDGANVLNFGAKGAGVLARELAKQNVNKIVAVTGDYQSAMVGRKKAKADNLTNLDFVSCNSSSMSSICYAEKFDYLLLELFHNGIFEDRILESVLYAKENLLSPECEFIPAKLNLKVFAYDCPYHRDMVQESKEFDILYGFNFAPFTEAMSKHIMGIYTRLTPDITTKISEDYTIKTFDFKTLKESTFEEITEIKISQAGKLTGLCTYFELQMPEGKILTNSPFDPQNKYMQRVFTPAASIYPDKDEIIKIKTTYDGNYRVLLV